VKAGTRSSVARLRRFPVSPGFSAPITGAGREEGR
jgi:hypothetical protein